MLDSMSSSLNHPDQPDVSCPRHFIKSASPAPVCGGTTLSYGPAQKNAADLILKSRIFRPRFAAANPLAHESGRFRRRTRQPHAFPGKSETAAESIFQ